MIDTHAHLNFPQFAADLAAVIERAKAAGINQLINIGTDAKTSEESVDLARSLDWVSASVGIHPHATPEFAQEFPTISRLAADPQVVAIGEIGLDYFRPTPSSDVQIPAFRQQLALAISVQKPIIIHSREAYDQTLELLESDYLPHLPEDSPRGVIHSFTGSLVQAEGFLRQGFYLGINNILTYPTSQLLRLAVADIPLDRIVLETDCPYLPPQALRGERSEPKDVKTVAEAIAEIKQISAAEVVAATTANARRLFYHD